MCKKCGARRLKLYDKMYDQFKSRAEIMDKVPAEIPRDQWVSYVEYRFKEQTMEMCKKNAENRKKQTISHIGGSKPNSRRRAEMMAKTGQKPGRGDFISLLIGMKMDHMIMRQQKRYAKKLS